MITAADEMIVITVPGKKCTKPPRSRKMKYPTSVIQPTIAVMKIIVTECRQMKKAPIKVKVPIQSKL